MKPMRTQRRGFDDSRDPSQGVPEAADDPRKCRAYGCPCAGSVGTDGRLLCSFHNDRGTSEWPEITSRLREHDWFMEFMRSLPKLNTDADRIALADRFWDGIDDHMKPGPGERQRFGLYEQRLWYELMYRVGSRQSRPQPREVHNVAIRGAISGWTRP